MSNPYTLVFGQPPLEIIERKAQTDRIISEFCQERSSNYLNLVTGIRGCGKTVFITRSGTESAIISAPKCLPQSCWMIIISHTTLT